MSDQLSADLQALRIDRDVPPPTGNGAVGRWVTWLIVLGVLGAAGAWALPRAQARIFKTTVRTQEIRSVSPTQAATSVSATGYVVALTISRVQPRATGRVLNVHVREGDTVHTGQVLLELDSAEQRVALTATQARAAAAQSRVTVARANITETQVQLERQRRLLTAGATSRSTVEDLEARLGPLRASVEAAVAEARASQADVASQRANLGLLTVSAPFDGVVLNRPPQVGELVGAGAIMGSSGNATAAVIEVMDPRSIVVEVDVPEGRLSSVHLGGPCEISLDAFPDRRLRGVVQEFGHRVDRAKATVPVRVRFVENAGAVLPEMSARVSFLNNEVSQEALTARSRNVVPAGAVTARGGTQVVFTVEDNVARMYRVQLGAREGEGFELIQGPSPGAHVVIAPPAALSDGSPVKEASQ
jgi:HlyD family secretion protein